MKYIHLNRTVYISLLLLFVGVMGCDKSFLEQKNPNTFSPDIYWTSYDNALKGIYGCYTPFSDIQYYGRMEIFVSDYRDDVMNPYNKSERTLPARFDLLPSSNMPTWFWGALWRGINRCNEALKWIPEIVAKTAKEKSNLDVLAGEAKFIRAINYFNVLRTYHNVPLLTEPIINILELEQAAPYLVWDQIVTDLVDAQKVLPKTRPKAETGRATFGAATGLLGKVYLYRATMYDGPAANTIQEYTNAKNEFQKLRDGSYILTPNYADNFSVYTENNSESVFEIQLVEDAITGWDASEGLNVAARHANWLTDIAAPQKSTENSMRVNDWVLELFLDEKTTDGQVDPRAFNTIIWKTNDTTFYEGDTLTDDYYLKKSYEASFIGETTKIYGKKYIGIDEKLDMAGMHKSGVNLRLIRYADILLMYTEAEFKLNGSSADALKAINEVRRRVKMPEFTAITMQDIMDERVKELTFERDRYYDLLRWGLVKQRIVDNKSIKTECLGTESYKPGREYFPIPSADVDFIGGLDQNPGYNE